jgi:hypothetical protein
MRSIARTLLLVVVATMAGGCDDDTTPTTPTPPVLVTETFTGALTVNGAQTHSFTTQAAGSLTATLTTVAPDNTVTVGLSLGIFTPSTNACQLVVVNTVAVQGTRVTGQASSAGSYCVLINDVGRLTEAANYTIALEHP